MQADERFAKERDGSGAPQLARAHERGMHVAPGRGQAQHVGDGEERGHHEQVILGEHLEAHSSAGRTFLRSFFGGDGRRVTRSRYQIK